ncbi:hypothetical protein [Cellulomonas edaphi]|uniref:Uncharacterized protein n=1 Tax=Cellulomonas edaphi TaxID=3053468 RepID=A0ABT7S8J2_9CELL|nr:hypothetical protein [Cellulomons edaphi]MDM7831943.1 hypothetical protein [Cellulomons edaphi]
MTAKKRLPQDEPSAVTAEVVDAPAADQTAAADLDGEDTAVLPAVAPGAEASGDVSDSGGVTDDGEADAGTHDAAEVDPDTSTGAIVERPAGNRDDETAVLPTSASEETAVLPTSAADETAVLPRDVTDETAVLAANDTARQPVTPAPAVSGVSGGAGVPLEKPARTVPAPAQPSEPAPTSAPTAAPTSAPATTRTATVEPPEPTEPPERRRLRVSTVVWGLMLVAAGIWILAWAAGARIDAQLTLIVLLAAGGVALLVGSIVSGARNARR